MTKSKKEKIWCSCGLTGDENTQIAIFYTVEDGGVNHYFSASRFSIAQENEDKKKTLVMESSFVDGFFHIAVKYPYKNFALVRGEPNEEQLNDPVFFSNNKIDCSVVSIKLTMSFEDVNPRLSVFETILLYMRLFEKFF